MSHFILSCDHTLCHIKFLCSLLLRGQCNALRIYCHLPRKIFSPCISFDFGISASHNGGGLRGPQPCSSGSSRRQSSISKPAPTFLVTKCIRETQNRQYRSSQASLNASGAASSNPRSRSFDASRELSTAVAPKGPLYFDAKDINFRRLSTSSCSEIAAAGKTNCVMTRKVLVSTLWNCRYFCHT